MSFIGLLVSLKVFLKLDKKTFSKYFSLSSLPFGQVRITRGHLSDAITIGWPPGSALS